MGGAYSQFVWTDLILSEMGPTESSLSDSVSWTQTVDVINLRLVSKMHKK